MLRSPLPRRRPRPPSALAPLAVAAALCVFAGAASAQLLPRVKATPAQEPPKELAGSDVPPAIVTLTADDVVSHIGGVTQASGAVDVKRLDVDLHADLLTYDSLSDTVHAQGNVRIARGLDWFSADRLDLELTREAGTLLGTEYEIGARKAGGRAQRVELFDRSRSSFFEATYTACVRDGTVEPDWIITGDQIDIDTATNEGRATHAVLRFLGVPILAAPTLTFPVTADRKSGVLPPTIEQSNRGGVSFSLPYYLNIAPDIDATVSPGYSFKRGGELGAEVRYLRPNDLGQVSVFGVPDDAAFREDENTRQGARGAVQWAHEGVRGDWLTYSARVQRVTDSGYWKDFPGQMPALTQRLLPTDLLASSRFLPFGASGEVDTYARVQAFQTLQDLNELDGSSLIKVPYQRSPQVGVRGNVTLQNQVRLDFEAEADRFDLANKTQEDSYSNYINCTNWLRFSGQDSHTTIAPEACLQHLQNATSQPGAPTALLLDDYRPASAVRAHVVGTLSRSFSSDWWRFEPRMTVHGVTYRTDNYLDANGNATHYDGTRVIPTFSADSSFSFERQASLFGIDTNQTLEPRLLYVLTPYHDQSRATEFDTTGKDFNEVSIFSTNQFTGNDRVNDADQLTAGITTRYSDAVSGRELLRLGVAQRFLFHDQRITTTDKPDTTQLSHLLLYGSSAALQDWNFDGIVEWNPLHQNDDPVRFKRAVVSTRYHPGPFKTVSLTYRFAANTAAASDPSNASKQYEVGGQWPVYHQPPRANGCGGTLYAVGRVDYSATDRRANYAIGGFEYDAGCWIGRVMLERTSTGRNESTNHLVLQLELNGLSTLGVGSPRVLKDNVPGYQDLRKDPGTPTAATTTTP